MGILINENQIGGGSSNSSHNIGDIFYTTRTDNSLNGAVECNGSQYNFSDFDSNLQSLFDDGKLPYVSIGEFDSMVTNQGGCDSFGYGERGRWQSWYDGVDTIYLQRYPIVGDNVFDSIDGSIIGIVSEVRTGETDYMDYLPTGSETPVTNFSVVNYFNYIILPTTYFKVPKKVGRVLVRSQKPTADNNYTWYNVYADGWVEQGGKGSTSASTAITFLIPMATSHYALSFGGNGASTNRNCFLLAGYNRTSTGFTLHAVVVNANSQTSGTSTDSSTWICAGYAAPSEYTKDKWNYQNVQVERPMVQLFNGNTDTALATCTSVLTDVSTLKDSLSTLKFKKVEALPDNPDTDTVYFII